MMTTLPREHALDALRSSTNELLSAASLACVDFVRVELKLAQTLLDMAVSAREEAARRRRVQRARDAAAAARRFITDPPPPIRPPNDERDRLASELDKVRERITSMR
jgi:hypothetical protein